MKSPTFPGSNEFQHVLVGRHNPFGQQLGQLLNRIAQMQITNGGASARGLGLICRWHDDARDWRSQFKPRWTVGEVWAMAPLNPALRKTATQPTCRDWASNLFD